MIRIFAVVAACGVLAACTTPQPRTELPAAPPNGEPAGIAGLGAVELKSVFGTPAFVRKDGTSEMWRYDNPRCRAFFFLFEQNGAQIVRHVETLPRGATMAADTTCLDALRVPAKVS